MSPAQVYDRAAPLHSITSSARASRVGGTSRPSVFAVLRLLGASFTCFRVGSRMAADHYLKVAPRVTMPPWNFDALTTAHVSWETSTAFPASTVMPSDEIVIRAGPFIVKNRPMR
jgi:hypothetical protein